MTVKTAVLPKSISVIPSKTPTVFAEMDKLVLKFMELQGTPNRIYKDELKMGQRYKCKG